MNDREQFLGAGEQVGKRESGKAVRRSVAHSPALPLSHLRVFLTTLAAFVALTTLSPAQPATKCGFLFIVDTSSAMSRLGEPAQITLASLVASGLHGEMRSGEEFTVWTFNDEVNARGLPVLSWAPEYSAALGARAAQHLKAQKFRRASRMDRLVPEVLAAMRATELLVAVIISDGNEVVVGTPFDRRINVAFGSRAEEMRRAKRPFVTTLAARRGEIVDFAVTLGDEPIALPGFRQLLAKAGAPGSGLAPFTPPTSVPVLMKPGAAPVVATNVLSSPVLTNRPSVVTVPKEPPPTPAIATAPKAPPPVPAKSTPAVEAVKATPVVATPAPQIPKRDDSDSASKAKSEPAAPPKEPKVNPPVAPPTPPPAPAVAKPEPILPATPPVATVSAVATSPPPLAKSVPYATPPATSVPVLITNRPPVASPKPGNASGNDFLGGQPPAPVPAPSTTAAPPPEPSRPVPPKQTPTPVVAPLTPILSEASRSNPPVAVPAASGAISPAPHLATSTSPPASAIPTAQAAVVSPVSRRGSSWWLAAGSVVLLAAGFWVIRPWLRRPEPESPTSLISRSMDDLERK